jgi:hypothetical protein
LIFGLIQNENLQLIQNKSNLGSQLRRQLEIMLEARHISPPGKADGPNAPNTNGDLSTKELVSDVSEVGKARIGGI